MGNLQDGSYSVKKITEWLDTKEIKHKYHSTNLDSLPVLTQTGLCVVLDATKTLGLSVQTDPRICGSAFAETALITKQGIIYDDTLGYSDVIRHYEKEDLFEHITQLLEDLKAKGPDYCPPLAKTQKYKKEDEGDEGDKEDEEDHEVPKDDAKDFADVQKIINKYCKLLGGSASEDAQEDAPQYQEKQTKDHSSQPPASFIFSLSKEEEEQKEKVQTNDIVDEEQTEFDQQVQSVLNKIDTSDVIDSV